MGKCWRAVREWLWLPPLALFGLAVVDAAYLHSIWPDWQALSEGPVRSSSFMERYSTLRTEDSALPPLRQQWVPLEHIPQPVARAVILAEDAKFWLHDGVDVEALQLAVEKNLERGKLSVGGSTISQQTVKNLFFSPARDPLRKWHELVLTLFMERNLSKRRILEIYLNIAEFGPGVYGVGAAAYRYWRKPVYLLGIQEAPELAAALPNPKEDNPATRTETFRWRADRIAGLLEKYGLGRLPNGARS